MKRQIEREMKRQIDRERERERDEEIKRDKEREKEIERERAMKNMVIEFISLLLQMAALQIKFFQI